MYLGWVHGATCLYRQAVVELSLAFRHFARWTMVHYVYVICPLRSVVTQNLLCVMFGCLRVSVFACLRWLDPSVFAFVICPHSARTVPAQCPHSARTVPAQCPHEKSCVKQQIHQKQQLNLFEILLIAYHILISPNVFHAGTVRALCGHCAGTVRALCGHCAGTASTLQPCAQV